MAAGFRQARRVYFVSLFGFVIWVGLLISWLFFSGFKPPLAKLRRDTLCRNPTSTNKSTAQAVEPLLPIEKKLIGWSLGLGLALLAILIAVNHFVPIKL